jgi:hypothetical protein
VEFLASWRRSLAKIRRNCTERDDWLLAGDGCEVGAESRGRRGMFPPVLEFRLRMILPRRRNLSPSSWGVSRMFSSVGELAPKEG